MSTQSPLNPGTSDHDRQIQQIVQEVVRRREAGEDISNEKVMQDHPNLLPELGEQLRALRPVGSGGDQDETIIDTSSKGDQISVAGSSRDNAETVQDSIGPLPRSLPNIEGYRIINVLGQGGMGIVYRAVQDALNRSVALKVLPAMVGSASPAAVARFRREATAAGRLHHTHIVPIYDFGESHDAYYYAMELITGEPLNVLIQRFREQNAPAASPAQFMDIFRSAVPSVSSDGFSLSSAGASDSVSPGGATVSTPGRGMVYYRLVARWIADAADALHYAHNEGIIHRDIKPANLIISVDGRIMVADFGLAKSADEPTVTMTGSLMGTLRYLSPEQAMAKRIKVDHRTDIYSLGLTLYELLTLQQAFPQSDEKKILAAIIQKDPVAPRKISPAVPSELEVICQKAIEKSPESRYPTAGAMAQDLTRYLNDLPISARAAGPVRRVIKFVKRRRAAVAMTVAILAVLGLAFAIPASIRFARERTEEKVRRLVSEANTFRDQAIRHNDRSRWDAADDLFKEAIELAPDDPFALGDYASFKKDMFNKCGRDPTLLKEANKFCDRALESNVDALESKGELSRLWNIKGVILKKLEKYDESLKAYAKAVELAPHEASTLENYGVLAALNYDLTDAEQTLVRAAALATEKEQPYCNIWQSLAQIQLLRQDAAAIDNIEKAVEYGRTDADVGLAEARVFLLLKGHEDAPRALDAVKAADRIASDDTPRARINRMLAIAHLRNGHYEKAIEHADIALREEDLAAINHLIIAVAYGRLGGHVMARNSLAAAKATWPKDLRNSGEFRPVAPTQTLWIESADELLDLLQEAKDLVPDGQD